MTNPENHLVQMTARGINNMVSKAIKPFADDNRKLRFMVGMVAEMWSIQNGLNPDITIDCWFKIASRQIEAMPDATPADLLMLCGRQYARRAMGDRKPQEIDGGDRPTPCGDDDLLRLLHDFADKLSDWFDCRYPERQNESWGDDDQNVEQFYRKARQNSVQSVALFFMEEVHMHIPTPISHLMGHDPTAEPDSDEVT